MKITYFGHSALQIETENTTLLVDPFISGNPLASGVISVEDLNPDVILLTHAHGDHFGDTRQIAGRTGALVVGTYEIAEYMTNKFGHTNVHPMNTGGKKEFSWGTVTLTYARHSSSFPDGSYGGTANGILLHLEGKTLLNTGDTCAFSEMAWMGEEEEIDLCLLPVGDNFTMGPKEAVRAAKMLKPKMTVPLHYNTFPYIEIDVRDWENRMDAAGLATTVLAPGGTIVL